MRADNEIRPGELAVPLVETTDASLVFIGRIQTPWSSREECPRQGRIDGPICRITLFEPWTQALDGISGCDRLEVLYWLHRARRDLVRQCAHSDPLARGTFALRSPMRPNPIGTSIVALEDVDGTTLTVRGLDCLDGTPLLDIKPPRHRLC